MDTIKHALVLTGEVQPGFAAADVWPALATYFRMEPERLRSELLSRAPISIKESDDLAKLQNLQGGAAAVGAVTELHVLDAAGSVFVLVDNTPRGPVPRGFVAERVRSGSWPSNINVAAVGSANWAPFAPSAPARSVPAAAPDATVAFSAMAADAGDFQTRAVSDLRAATPASAPFAAAHAQPAAAGDLLPEGPLVHGGFWRRLAAYMADSLILGIPLMLIGGILGYANVQAAMSGEAPGGMMFLAMFVFYIAAIVGSWLYFAKFESGARQATPGKRLMGLKVTNDRGLPISFGRASGRFFGKIVTNLIPFGIGWMLAGWTGRKQALHDMMAGTCVVFREVEPGRAMPTTLPKMPWYGWALNILPFALSAIAIAGYSYIIAMMIGGARQEMSGLDMSEIVQESSSSMSQASDADAEKALVRAGLSAIFDEVENAKSEAAQALVANNECMTEDRPSNNAWIESIQFGGFAPQCSVTVRLSSSSDIPFAARIERIEWTWDGNQWACSSSMDSSYLPWPCQ